MKKTTWIFTFLIAIGICSAFANRRPFTYLVGKTGSNSFGPVLDISQKGIDGPGGWECDPTINDTCVFALKFGVSPNKFSYNRSEVEYIPGLLEYLHSRFYWIQ